MVEFITGLDGMAKLASYTLMGVNTSVSTSLDFFSMQTATYPLFWKAVGLIERMCNLSVTALTKDKAILNQPLYDMNGMAATPTNY